jgi:hypothetical protein
MIQRASALMEVRIRRKQTAFGFLNARITHAVHYRHDETQTVDIRGIGREPPTEARAIHAGVHGAVEHSASPSRSRATNPAMRGIMILLDQYL